MSSSLWEKINYSADCDYLTSTFIREYDIRKANISILFNKGIISQDEYNNYMNMDRMQRQIDIGIRIKNNSKLYEIIKDGIIEAKKMFFEVNNIEDNQILTIKNDAVFLINTVPKITKFSNIEFVEKNTYTSFYKLNKIEYYYFYDQFTDKEILDIKGIGDEILKIHEKYFYEFLCVVFNSAQLDPIEETINIISNFYNQYINYKLDVQYYRRFDSTGLYDIKTNFMYSSFRADYIDESQKYYLDISYNASIIMELYKIFSTIYFRNKK